MCGIAYVLVHYKMVNQMLIVVAKVINFELECEKMYDKQRLLQDAWAMGLHKGSTITFPNRDYTALWTTLNLAAQLPLR